ncbi:hypothetical protein ANCDUO_09349 [Ancylostoma duodenale]|uniref:Reverse transcriptase domain-containing protein n=1 Tax=Ancylostoma duodenale TaxID=51022 RepID=A0A0C2DDB3_9BILA|nr:hypothetical protein ANCDUO_09349 [Ancylostoma duodenale]
MRTTLPSWQKVTEATTSLNREAKKIGLRITSEKSKVVKIGTTHAPINIDVGDVRLENVARLTYLGSTVACDGDAEFDVRARIAKAAAEQPSSESYDRSGRQHPSRTTSRWLVSLSCDFDGYLRQ